MSKSLPEMIKLMVFKGMKFKNSRTRVVEIVVLIAIVGLAAILRFSNLSVIGYGNQYYTAAIKSMLQSWHNFFFVAAEPGGSVSIDKPPVGFWLQAISAYFLGVSGFAVVLPQLIAGLLSVIVVYHLVRRTYGPIAGSLAALVLAIAPVVIATDRNNTIDSTLILVLLLGSWAFIKATETGRLRFLLLGAGLVGIGFNIKMLEAYLPLPAFYALYFLGSSDRIWLKIKKLALTSVVLLVVSLLWAVVVDLTPASERPYVGSSGDNSEMSLIFGYNGIQRLLGTVRGRGNAIFDGFLGSVNPGENQYAQNTRPQFSDLGGYQPFSTRNSPLTNSLLSSNATYLRMGNFNGNLSFEGSISILENGRLSEVGQDGGIGGRQLAGGGIGGNHGIMDTGNPGVLRLFTEPLNKEMSWLLPFGILCTGILIARDKIRWPITQGHQFFILWGGWLLTASIFFSIAGFFHQYYLSTLVPPLAALVGIGVIELWKLRREKSWLAFSLLVLGVAGSLGYQLWIAQSYLNTIWWTPGVIALGVLGALLLAIATIRTLDRLAITGYVCLVTAILITPGIWSGLTTLSDSINSGIPAAYGGGTLGQASQSNLNTNESLIEYLERNTQEMKYLLAVSSATEGEGFVLETGRPVLYMGGFNGQDQVVNGDDLAKMVADGDLRYILGNGSQSGGQSDISAWIFSNCTTVPDSDFLTDSSGGFSRGGNLLQGTLYDCKATK